MSYSTSCSWKKMASSGTTPSSFFPTNFFLQMQTPNEEEEEEHLSIPLLPSNPCTNHQDFRAWETMLAKRSMSFSGIEPCYEMNGGGEDDLSDDCSQAGEKKRRLSIEQARTLEKNFELGNKLEPERKLQLARALGLQPRQIAIWFQNRRARWKTKQLEKDYEVLKKQFETVMTENGVLKAQNKKLQAEIMGIRGTEVSELINLNKETEGSCSNRSDNSSEINLDISRNSATESPLHHHQSLQLLQSLRPPPTNMTQLFHTSSRSEIQCPRIERGVPDENFSNLLCTMEDQPAFWPWSDRHNFH